jgi:hypothetical protein
VVAGVAVALVVSACTALVGVSDITFTDAGADATTLEEAGGADTGKAKDGAGHDVTASRDGVTDEASHAPEAGTQDVEVRSDSGPADSSDGGSADGATAEGGSDGSAADGDASQADGGTVDSGPDSPACTTTCPSLLLTNETSVLNFNVSTGSFIGTFTSGGSLKLAYGIAIGPDGNLYVCDFENMDIVSYNGATGVYIGVFATLSQYTGDFPVNLAFGPDRNLYVGLQNEAIIVRFNGTTGASMGTFVPAPTTGLSYTGMTFHGGSLFVTYLGSPSVLYQFNATTGALVAELYSGFSANGPRAPAFGPDGNLYVPDWQTPNVLKFDGTTYAFLGNFISDSALSPISVGFGPDGNIVVVNDPGTVDSVRRYALDSGAFLDTLVATGSGGLGRSTQVLVVTP